MRFETDPKDRKTEKETEQTPEDIKQKQTDPNLTELKGFIDPDEKLEPEGTDNPF